MTLRPLGFFLLCTAAAFAQSTPPRGKAAAPPPEVAATVQLTPTGDLAGQWQAWVVEVDNKTTRELDLTIHIDDESCYGVATRRERLAAAARKRLFLYSVGTIYMRSVPPRYRITDASNRELASGIVAINMRGSVNNPYQIGLFARTAASSDDFGIPSGLNGQE